ncbi:MAG: hypothetical protein ACOC1F_02940, partial [Myxococcota bacterium]
IKAYRPSEAPAALAMQRPLVRSERGWRSICRPTRRDGINQDGIVMNVLSMQVTEARKHPHVDALWIYRVQAPDAGSLLVIANEENTHELGDCVIVARVGAQLRDGTGDRCVGRGVRGDVRDRAPARAGAG